MSVEVFSKVEIERFFIKTNVNAIKVLKNVILIGTGGYLIIYDRNCEKVVSKTFIFDETITGIDYEDDQILIYAENILGLFQLESNKIIELNHFCYNDWILHSKFLDNKKIIFVSIHSEAVILDQKLNVLKTSKSTEICTCYCCLIINKNWDDLFVLSGTAFSEIFIWKPSIKINDKSPVLYKIKGHKGVIFSIDYSEKLDLICSTSDDGKAMIWNAKDFFNQQNTENDKPKEIVCIKELQHRQRVFKGKFFNNFLVTTLEDSTIKIWNSNFKNKTCTHQIGPIWCLDFCEENNLVFTGGADGGIISTPLNFDFNSNKSKINNKNVRYKDFVVLNHKVGVGITNIGELNLINNHDLIEKHDDLNSYCLIKKSPCKKLICLAGMYGNLHLYQLENDKIIYKISCNIKNNPKIFSLHWLSCKSFLVCLNEGILVLWYYKNDVLIPIQFFQLPPMKERWSTSAAFCGDNHLIVGDRRGNLSVFEIESGCLKEVLKKIQPNGVTQLYFNQQKQEVIVLGRNSIFQKYNFNPKNNQNNHLTLITKDKLPFSWLGSYELINGKEIILGFSTDKFLIYNQTWRRIIFEVNCGGGHRLWDYHLSVNLFTLVYQKVDKLISIEFNLKENEVKNVLESFHGTETNCMKLIVIKTTPFQCISISGGEDTTLRLLKIDFENKLNGFEVINVIKSHLSSIRVVVYHKIGVNEYFVFSGGGRAQIILWKLVFGENIIFQELFSYYKELDEFESEIRIMDLTTVEVNEKIILFSACSNGDIKIYQTDLNKREINYLFKISHKKRCILKLFTIKFENLHFLVTTSTDGFINFFNITDFQNNNENSNISFVTSLKTNQSGINSVSFDYLTENKAVILTGGDDKAFSLNLIECNNNISGVTIKRLSYFSDENHHFAHITGAFITNSYFITASIDQKVIIFHWELNNNRFKIEKICKKITHVTDLQGIDYVFNKNKLELVLFGNGFEIFSVNLH